MTLPTRPSTLRVALIAAAVTLLTACQTYSPQGFAPGTTVAQLQAGMGPPTASYPMPDGARRLEYARGPFGKHTYMVDVDAKGQLVRSTQVLTEATFATVRPGMTRDDVLRTIGRPSDVKWLPRQQHSLWSYRYDSPFCVWFQVSLDTAGRVAEVGQGPDPLCEVNDRRRF